MPHLSKIGNPS